MSCVPAWIFLVPCDQSTDADDQTALDRLQTKAKGILLHKVSKLSAQLECLWLYIFNEFEAQAPCTFVSAVRQAFRFSRCCFEWSSKRSGKSADRSGGKEVRPC